MPITSKRQAPGAARRVITPELIRDALAAIPADVDRDTWARVGMAVKASDLATDAAFELWNEWSARGASYTERNTRDTWRSIKASGSVTVGTLFGIAKDYGFKFPDTAPGQANATQPDASEAAARLALDKQQQRDEEAQRYRQRADDAARVATSMWAGAAEPATPAAAGYLVRKAVPPYGVRCLPDGTLLVPMRNAAGELQNLQRIAATKPADGAPDKRFLPGGRKSGLWHLLGAVDSAAVLLVAEGYATAATLHEATGRPVVVAFDAGNLVHVVRELRTLHPALPLLLCGDDDSETEARTGKNPGREQATSAARAVHTTEGAAGVVLPTFAPGQQQGRTDFNDLAAVVGLDAVRAAVEPACAALLLPEPAAPVRNPRARPVSTAQGGAGAAGGADVPPAAATGANGPPATTGGAAGGGGGGGGGGGEGSNGNGKGAAASGGGSDNEGGNRDPFELDELGVWYLKRDREGNTRRMWLCTPLNVTARTRAEDANGWGLLLTFTDPDGNPKTWAMPSAMLSGDGPEWAGRLRDMGLRMAPGAAARNLIGQYVDTRNPPERVTCTDRVGWHGPVFVLPAGCIGKAEGNGFVFQSEAGMEDTFKRRGTPAQWRDNVAALAQGNSRLVFAVACAFAGPALRLAGMEGGGVHLRGASSVGKTTALKAAASVWGRPTFMQTWRNTTNALEATAVQHSDCTLILDELAQLDPREAGDCAYLLSNGQEKGRNMRGGMNRKRRSWRLLFLSSGEISLADHMAEGGRRTQAGMDVRMADVPLDAGAGMGGIEETHGHEGPAALADALTAAAARHYGTAGRAWLEWLCEHHGAMPERLPTLVEKYRTELVPAAASEQVRRVGSRFGLIAAAGELATEAGITGWPTGHAAWGVRECFNAWLGARGHLDNGEDAAMLRQARAWLEKNGDALLTWTHRAMDDHKAATPLRSGFKRLVDDEGKALKLTAADYFLEKRSASESNERLAALVEFLVLPETFKRDVCKGFDAAAVARVLKRRGHLVHEADRLTIKQRLPGMGKVAVYHIKPSIFADDFGVL